MVMVSVRELGGSAAVLATAQQSMAQHGAWGYAAMVRLGMAGISVGPPLPGVKASYLQVSGSSHGFCRKNGIIERFSVSSMAGDDADRIVRLRRAGNRKSSALRCAVIDQDFEVAVSRDGEARDGDVSGRLQRIITDIAAAGDTRARIRILLDYASSMPCLPAEDRTPSNRVMGCTNRVWLTAKMDNKGRMIFAADSDSEVTRGLSAVLLQALNGSWPESVLAVSTDALGGLGIGIEGVASRANTWYNLLITIQKRTRLLVASLENRTVLDLFPSLLITADDIVPQGDFAKVQARYLSPDQTKVEILTQLLTEKQIGVVAHFYMDPEVQGILVAAQKTWPHIHISDSLVMADRAVNMADAGCKHIAVLGVDFMSENVRAILDRSGHEKVRLYRMSSDRIGCSLADAAQGSAYLEFLKEAASSSPSLHVIYINTSLETKAQAHALIPTITCTSSNVVQTILQAFAQVPNLSVWYGPDSYMGENLAELFLQMTAMTDEDIKAIHPLHDKRTIAALLSRLHYFHDGSCIVHNLFGEEVVARVRHLYADAYQTAHFEVPGEMFDLAMEAKQRGMGVVGSTQNILDFIKARMKEALDRGVDDHLQFILGTESGMITAIVESVRKELNAAKSKGMKVKVEAEIVFPVSSDAITPTSASSSPEHSSIATLPIVPGVSSGEGCSLTGGCASCPYMKMNTLDALVKVCQVIETPYEGSLQAHRARTFDSVLEGSAISELGSEPILHMRYFQANGRLSDELVEQISSKNKNTLA